MLDCMVSLVDLHVVLLEHALHGAAGHVHVQAALHAHCSTAFLCVA